MAVQPALATKWVPFTCDVGGTNCHNDIAASDSKADSVSAAESQNTVKCFAFCFGTSTANSGSVANSDSRANSPGTSSNAMPVEPKTTTTFQQPDTMEGPLKLKPEQMTRDCIDNTGSRQDTGYAQGYADGQRDVPYKDI